MITLFNMPVLGLYLRINDWFVCLDWSDYFVYYLFYVHGYDCTTDEYLHVHRGDCNMNL